MNPARLLIFSILPFSAFAQTVTLPPEQRGDLYMARKMYREAADVYRQNAGKSAVMWDKAGIAYHQLGDLNGARKAYERAIRIDKKYPDAINNVGTVFYAQKKYRSAISRYKRALQIAPDSASIWSNLGTAWYARGRFDLMNDAYTKALQLDPDVFEKNGSVGTRMLDRGVTDKARYHFEMARLYAGTGKNELALQYLRKALEEGFKEREKVQQLKEFSTLRDTQEFKDLMALEPRVL
jgi:tetratricopeptide (TPR) repeat protein